VSAEPNDFADHVKELAADYERMYKTGHATGYASGYREGFKAATDKALELVNKSFPSKVQV
jgi:flagellar biosynthesis/type III secretory pathway protein FliH